MNFLCDCFQENKKDEIVKSLRRYIPAFHPKAFNVFCDLAGLLAWLQFLNLPVRRLANSGWSLKLFPCSPFRGLGGLTATGIAPDLHRTSLLTPTVSVGEPNRCKCREGFLFWKKSFQQWSNSIIFLTALSIAAIIPHNNSFPAQHYRNDWQQH